MLKKSINKSDHILFIAPPLDRILNIRYNLGILKTKTYGYLGPLNIATYLKKNGFNTSVYNANLKRNNDRETEDQAWKNIKDDICFLLKSKNPSIIGISILTPQLEFAIKIARFIKEVNKNIIIVVGGWHPTFMPEVTINIPFFNFVVRGEGEDTMLELVKALIENDLHQAIANPYIEDPMKTRPYKIKKCLAKPLLM